MKFRNYKNSFNNSNRIFSEDDVLDMTLRTLFDKENDVLAQNRDIGIPTQEELKSSSNVVWVEEYVRDDGTKVCGHWRSKPENDSEDNSAFQQADLDGGMTGGAAKVNHLQEGTDFVQSNDEFFEKKRKFSFLMQTNSNMNKNRPDAKLFMDIALVHPKNVPSTKDYHFISSENVEKINKELNLVGNKEIPKHYDGFVFNINSPTAMRLNASEELKREVFSEKNFDKGKGCFKRDKLEIDLKEDKNLQYSFGHLTIIKPQITKDGYIVGLGYDLYNFGKLLGNPSKETIEVNNKAIALQTIGIIKNYFIFVPIRIKI